MDKLIDVRLGGIRALSIVIERGSISAAANHMGITPSAVSKQITRLEKDVGARLLQRSTRSVRPTEAGLKLHNRARPLLDALADTVGLVSSEDAELSGVVRISATPAYGRIHVVPALAQLSEEHPQLRFDLKLSDRIHDFIEDEIDIAIREGTLNDSNLYAVLLREGAVNLFASPEYLEHRGAVESIDSLALHDLILVARTGMTGIPMNAQVKQLLRNNVRFTMNDVFAVCDLAIAGRGIAGLPDYVAEQHLKSGELVSCLPEFTPLKLPVHAVYPNKRLVPKRVQVVLNKLSNSSR
jgi:DNA-binding transcriptional LysR family regulator